MNRRTLIAIGIWGVIIFVGLWIFGAVKDYLATKDQIPIAYSEVISLLKNEDLLEVNLKTFTNGHEIILKMKDGKVFSSFSSDRNLHDRVLSNPNVKLSESQAAESVSLGAQIISLVFFAGLVLAVGFILRDTFRKREADRLRSL